MRSRSASSIAHACWWVRYYGNRGRGVTRLQRAQAILRLGLVVRETFSKSDDFEPLLRALADGLHPSDDPPF